MSPACQLAAHGTLERKGEGVARAGAFLLVLEPSPESVGVARRAVEGWIRQVDAICVLEIVVLLVSEVATNVVKHAGTAYALTAHWLPPVFRVEVTDSAPPPVKRVTRRAGEIGGWGFEVLDQLSRAWGIDERNDGMKAVWFEVELPGASDQ
jgi:anti-sigma regulatory factor (Ser/Thr protein kinase)